MTKKLSYKYINLLLRIGIGVVAFWIIIDKLKNNFISAYENLSNSIHYELIFITFCLLFLNWGIEAYKWRYLIRKTEKISFIKAFKLTITGVSISMITPNRIGEIPGRALLINKKDKLKDLIVSTAVGAYSQLLITFIFGTFASFFVLEWFETGVDLNLLLFFMVIFMLFLTITYFFNQHLKSILNKIPFIKNKKILDVLDNYSKREVFLTLILSALRYIVFSFQYYLVLIAFDIHFDSSTELLLIPFCFMISSVIPTFIISEIAVRGSVALFVFGLISNNHIAIVSASLLLWFINVGVPALLGLLFLNRLKLLSKT